MDDDVNKFIQFFPVKFQFKFTEMSLASAKLCGVEQRAPPIFGRAAITLSIGPHSSFHIVYLSCHGFNVDTVQITSVKSL